MLGRGAEALSNAELLAILIGSGTQKENVLEVANRILARNGGMLSGIAGMSMEDMKETSGIGVGRYCAIIAALELGKRRFQEETIVDKVPLDNPMRVWKMMIPQMKGMKHEELWVLFLNKANMVIHKEMVSMGGSCSTIVDPKIIVKKALDVHATGLLMVHNHPSGDPRPGMADIEETANMKNAAKTFDISIVDHVIVCDDCFFSFSEDGTTMVNGNPKA